MAERLKTLTFKVQGMTCVACERHIEAGLAELIGMEKCRASYSRSTVTATFDPARVCPDAIKEALAGIDYPVVEPECVGHGRLMRRLGPVLALAAIIAGFVLLERAGVFYIFPMADQNTALPMLFVIGLFTSLHCVAMCGGIAISQCAGAKADDAGRAGNALAPGLLYNAGRVLSYTAIGGIVGAIGATVTPSGGFKGIVAIAAAVFMLIMGLNLLGLFPILRRMVPRMPTAVATKIRAGKAGRGPFIVGLLNGLMPCGPLQAMQLYALSSGSLIMGATSMLLFSIGTVPLMLGLGALSAVLSAKFTGVMTKISAVLVMLLGLMMLNTGLSLSGFNPLF